MLRIQVASLCLKIVPLLFFSSTSSSFTTPLLLSPVSTVPQHPLFPFFDRLFPSVLIRFPSSRCGSSGCSTSAFLWLSTLDPVPSRNCLFSLRRHCCLNLMPVLSCCCCCSNSMLAHPMTFLGLNFVSFPSRLFCPDIPSRAFPLLPPSQCLSTPLQSALDSSLCALVSPSP